VPPGKRPRDKGPSFLARLGGAVLGGASAPIALLAWEFDLELIATAVLGVVLATVGFMMGPKVWEAIVEWL
jgi:hypothetical protein